MNSIFCSTKDEQELIAKNVIKMLNDRSIEISKDDIINVIQNHSINIINVNKVKLLIAFVSEKEASAINKLDGKYDSGIIIWDSPKMVKADKKYYDKNIDTFNKQEFYVNLVSCSIVPKHEIVGWNEDYMNIRKCDYPVILWSDPVMRYYGGRIGDLVRIERHSVRGISFYYRVVK